MTVPEPQVCARCDGDGVIVVAENEVAIVTVPCQACKTLCGCGRLAAWPGGMCDTCDDESFIEFDARAKRRADV